MHCSDGRPQSIEITVKPHGGIRGRCSRCRQPAPGYDRLPQRRWLFVPLWGIPTHFCYAPRRVECAEHGVVVEHIPWSGQASSDMRHDGVLGTLGATDELAGNGASVPDQLGSGVSVGGMVCRVG